MNRSFAPELRRPSLVLAGSSLGPESDAVVLAALRLARSGGGRVHAMHALEPPAVPGGTLGFVMGASRLAAEARTRLREQLDRVGATPGETAGLQVEVGAPGQVLCAAAERLNADAVVVGVGSAERSIGLGSTVHHLLRRGMRTVLVVKGSPRIPPQRVLAPVDLSHDAADSLRCGLGLLAGDGYGGLPELVAFHAVDERRGETDSRPDESFASFLEEHTADYRGPVRSLVRHGDAVAEILAAGKREQPDLLLLGTHGRSGWQRLRLGSVAEAVLRDSPTSVLVVPPAAAFGSSIAEAVGDWVRGER